MILSNPSIRIAAHAPAWKLFLAEILLKIAPRITMTTGLRNDQLTHDPAVKAEIESDPLRHGRISPPLYFGMVASGRIALDRSAEIRLPILVMLTLTGGLINAVQVTMYALAAHIYPSAVRATGVGAAAGIGRLGAILSGYAGAWAIDYRGSASYFAVIAVTMCATGVSLALIKRHVPATPLRR